MDPVLVSFIVYTTAIVALGTYSARFAQRSASDFFLAGRRLGAWVAGLSSSASAESGWVTLGLVGMAYKVGAGALWIVVGTFAAFVFNWFVLAWRLRSESEKHDALTLPDVLAAPFRGPVAVLIRCVGVLIILSMLTAYVAAQLNAAGKTFAGTFGWNYPIGVLLGAGIVLLYTVTGGFRAIAWTDVVQAIIMILTMILLPAILIGKVGGPVAFWEKLGAQPDGASLTDAFGGKSGFALIGFLALWLGVPLGNPGQPHVLVRLMAVKDRRAIRRGGMISSAWVLILFTGAVLLGMAARVYFGHLDDPEQILPIITRDSSIVPGFIGGMIIAAILAAICSTADSQLLVAASSVSHDLLVRVFKVNASLTTKMIIDRAAVVLIGTIATAIALVEVRSVFSFVLDYGWAGLGAGFGPALILRLCWRRTTGWGVLAGMIVGVATAVIWKQFPDLQAQVYNLVPAFALSMLTIIAVSLGGQSGGAKKVRSLI